MEWHWVVNSTNPVEGAKNSWKVTLWGVSCFSTQHRIAVGSYYARADENGMAISLSTL